MAVGSLNMGILFLCDGLGKRVMASNIVDGPKTKDLFLIVAAMTVASSLPTLVQVK